MLRPQMIQSGLQVVAHNLNRKNNDLRLFEIGKTYTTTGENKYQESKHLVLYISGNTADVSWNQKGRTSDFYYLKGVIDNIFNLALVKNYAIVTKNNEWFDNGCEIISAKKTVAVLGSVSKKLLKQFDIKHPVFFADIDFDFLHNQKTKPIQYQEIPKFPEVNRDLALVVDKNVSYSQIEQIALSNKFEQLKNIQLFDIFESDKLGVNKKSMAVSFTFLDENKTMTDKEIDGFMQKLITDYEKTIQAEIRK
jgi:phenylalanyl-tRNA synthetase beta chain